MARNHYRSSLLRYHFAPVRDTVFAVLDALSHLQEMAANNLTDLRCELDELGQELVELVARRFNITRAIGARIAPGC